MSSFGEALPANRETHEELSARMETAERLVPPGEHIRHVRTGGIYVVKEHHLRVGDLALMVSYSPIHRQDITFGREALHIQAKFVRTSGEPWPTGDARPARAVRAVREAYRRQALCRARLRALGVMVGALAIAAAFVIINGL